MKIFSNIRLLLISLWLGASVFFIGVAQTAFAVLPERELAGAIVGRTLAILNYSGLVIALISCDHPHRAKACEISSGCGLKDLLWSFCGGMCGRTVCHRLVALACPAGDE